LHWLTLSPPPLEIHHHLHQLHQLQALEALRIPNVYGRVVFSVITRGCHVLGVGVLLFQGGAWFTNCVILLLLFLGWLTAVCGFCIMTLNDWILPLNSPLPGVTSPRCRKVPRRDTISPTRSTRTPRTSSQFRSWIRNSTELYWTPLNSNEFH
jgi:hypothetical protein